MRKLIWSATLLLSLPLLVAAGHWREYRAIQSDEPPLVTRIGPGYVLRLHNQARAEAGLPPLAISQELQQSARAKGLDMKRRGYWDHRDPDGNGPWHFLEEAGYDYENAGENLAQGFDNVYEEQRAWMDSEGHRRNILDPKYEDIGIYINGTTVVVHFGDEL